MVKIALRIQATLENVTSLEIEDKDFRWYLKLQCANCGETPDHFQYISLLESESLKGGRGEASCVLKCKFCSRENSIDIIEDSITAYNMSDSGRLKNIVSFDCRGLQPVEFSPRSGWTCKGFKVDEEEDDSEGRETGVVFDNIDLGESEWADYDEKSDLPTSISELKFDFVKLK